MSKKTNKNKKHNTVLQGHLQFSSVMQLCMIFQGLVFKTEIK